jgi:protoporphyrinogen oxidase
VDALVKEITRAGGKLHLRSGASRVLVANGAVTGVETPQGVVAADYVISTVPVQLVPALVPDLPESWKAQYEAIVNIGICCVLFKLRRSVSPHFWVNIHDTEHEIPGVIEFSNLRPMNEVIIYVPYYMPVVNHKFSWTDEQLQQDAFACLQKLNPQLQSDDVIAAYTGRLRHAQPICEPGFAAKIPPIQTPIVGLQVADTCFYYPEDRGIAESVRLGRAIARSVGILGAATS